MYKNLIIPIKNSKQELIIHRNVFKTISKYIQINDKPESGGLLFAKFELPRIIINDLSVPHKNDYQSRYEFKPDQTRRQQIINSCFQRGLHYIGEWHTHPEKEPVPSLIDINSMEDIFIRSKHELNYFILIIAGNCLFENRFWIGLQNATKTINIT
jgi:integrative and conjugative element protein (TIGR02256 family)